MLNKRYYISLHHLFVLKFKNKPAALLRQAYYNIWLKLLSVAVVLVTIFVLVFAAVVVLTVLIVLVILIAVFVSVFVAVVLITVIHNCLHALN